MRDVLRPVMIKFSPTSATIVALCLLALSGCASPRTLSQNSARYTSPTHLSAPLIRYHRSASTGQRRIKRRSKYKVGRPYTIRGVTYVPRHDPGYDRAGRASWYGPGLRGRTTANGEMFREDRLAAAHPTLPLPSLVRVTNLDNGRQVIVRVNDRGPFIRGRIIDLTRRGADALGFTRQGGARVRVQFLRLAH